MNDMEKSTQCPVKPEIASLAGRYTHVHRPDSAMSSFAETFLDDLEAMPEYSPTIGCVIPAYNESESIASVIQSLLGQARVPDVIHVVINNTTDDTFEIAAGFAGPHRVEGEDGRMQETEVRSRSSSA